jgi:hypothetical protein
VIVNAVVEGLLDDAVVRRLLTLARLEPGGIYAKGGKSAIREKLAAFNQAARITPWFVLVDLDTDADCAAGLKSNWLPFTRSNPGCWRIGARWRGTFTSQRRRFHRTRTRSLTRKADSFLWLRSTLPIELFETLSCRVLVAVARRALPTMLC